MIPNWLTISQSAGTGDAFIIVTATTREELTSRSASLLVSTSTQQAYVTVNQTGEASISVNPPQISVNASGGNYAVFVTSDVEWHVNTGGLPTWITITYEDANGFGVRVSANSNEYVRNVTIPLQSPIYPPASGYGVYIKQAATAAAPTVKSLTVSPPNATVDTSGGSVNYTLVYSGRSGDTVTVSTPYGWSYTPVSWTGETGATTVTVPSTQNLNESAYTLTFSGSGVSTTAVVTQLGEDDGIYYGVPLTILFKEAGKLYIVSDARETLGVPLNKTCYLPPVEFEYKVNSGPWEYFAFQGEVADVHDSLASFIVSGNSGTRVQLRATNNTYLTSLFYDNGLTMIERPCYREIGFQFLNTNGTVEDVYQHNNRAQFDLYGNIMSMFYSNNLNRQTSRHFPITGSNIYAFGQFDSRCPHFHYTKVKDASALNLFAGDGSESYYKMFMNSEITSIPAFSMNSFMGTTAACQSMFISCTTLTTVDSLPVMELGRECYSSMFAGCTSLTKAPSLPARTLATACYSGMFGGCTSLRTAPALPALDIPHQAYGNMFNGCTSLSAAPSLPCTRFTTGDQHYYGMFSGCTSLTSIPTLPATQLGNGTYEFMFAGCTGLTSVYLPNTNLYISCYYGMFSGCTNLYSAAIMSESVGEQVYAFANMFKGCSNLGYVECRLNRAEVDKFSGWMDGVPNGGTFVKPIGSSWDSGIIPDSWTVVER